MALHVSLAPFQGITGKDYRRAFVQHFPGLDAVYAPFISGVHPQKPNPTKFTDVLPRLLTNVQTVPQFVSTDSQEVIAIGKLLYDHGYEHINWNMGCPFSRLANKMRGCGILPYPDEINRLLDKIIPDLPLKLSIKCRLGYRKNDELFHVLEVFNDYPLHKVIIHPRTGNQLYKGDVHLGVFGDCAKISKHKVVYNGDIYHAKRFVELQEMFPQTDHWMVGRGALINPFLPAEMKGVKPTDIEKRKLLKGFHDNLMQDMSEFCKHEKKLLGQLKAVWYYLSGAFSGGENLFQSLKVCADSHSYINFVDEMLQLPFANHNQTEWYWKNGLKHV